MKLLFLLFTITFAYITLTQAIEEEENKTILVTVYETVIATRYNDERNREIVKPTGKKEESLILTSTPTPRKARKEDPENTAKTTPSKKDVPVPSPENQSQTPMKGVPPNPSRGNGALNKEIPNKAKESEASSSSSSSSLASKAASSESKLTVSATMLSASASSSEALVQPDTAFSFSPITLAPESTKSGGDNVKATASVSKPPAKSNMAKNVKMTSSASNVVPQAIVPAGFFLFMLALEL